MVIAVIFLLHIIFAVYIFVTKWKRESPGTAFLNLAFIIILFSIGWSILTMFAKIFFEQEGFGKHFDRDTISLFTLTVIEFFFYRIYYWKDKPTEGGTEIQ